MYYFQKKFSINYTRFSIKKFNYKVRIRVLLPAGDARVIAPLSPTLGQFGLSCQDFCKKFNEESVNFLQGLILIVYVDIFFDRTFKFAITNICFMELIFSVASGYVTNFLSFVDFYGLVQVHRSLFPSKSLLSSMRTLIGCLRGSPIKLVV